MIPLAVVSVVKFRKMSTLNMFITAVCALFLIKLTGSQKSAMLVLPCKPFVTRQSQIVITPLPHPNKREQRTALSSISLCALFNIADSTFTLSRLSLC